MCASVENYFIQTINHDDAIEFTSPMRSPVNSPHKSQWRGALMLSNKWLNDPLLLVTYICIEQVMFQNPNEDDLIIYWKL